MNMMKRVIAAVLMLTLALSLCACGGSNTETNETNAPTEGSVPTETSAPVVEETEPPVAEFTGYTVTVVDENGAPIAGAMVQLCMDTCFPSVTNEEGVAQFPLDEADYKVSFMALPAGYTYTTEEQEFYFESGSKEMTIVLKVAE